MNLRYFLFLSVLFLGACTKKEVDNYTWETITVTATAYNSLRYQTSAHPNITAWGDSLLPGMKYIAVSRDLLHKGLSRNTPVKLDGFEGIYLVKDKMHRRWKNRIDIYMGVDVKQAKQWGKRKLKIQYGVLRDDLTVLSE